MKNKIYLYLNLLLITFILVGCNDLSSSYNSIDYQELWSYSKGDDQIIAFIDTGISNDLLTLYGSRVVNSYNAIDNSTNVTDEVGHGTSVISIASGDGQKEVYGIAPKSKIMPIKAIGNDGKVNAQLLEKSINYAIEKKANIINLSLGTHVEDENVKNAIIKAINANITVVASAGDYGQKDLLFPASLDGVISVTSLDDKGNLWLLSNTSEKNICMFPGVNVKSLSTNHISPTFNNGTSYSCALASGYIAIMRSYMNEMRIDISNAKIVSKMKLISINGNNNKIDYEKPIELLNYHSFSTQLDYMINNNPVLLIIMIIVIIIIIYTIIVTIRKRKSNFRLTRDRGSTP